MRHIFKRIYTVTIMMILPFYSIIGIGEYGNMEDPELRTLAQNLLETGYPVWDAAFNYYRGTRQTNKTEIDWLLTQAQGNFNLPVVKEKIAEEQTIYEAYGKFFTAHAEVSAAMENPNPFGPDWELRISVGKLWSKSEQLPICESAVHQLTLNSNLIQEGMLSMPPVGNQVTALKYGLLASYLVSKNYENIGHAIAAEPALLDSLTLLYPAPIPANANTKGIQKSLLYDPNNGDPRLWISNAGYVFGANPVNSKTPVSAGSRSFADDSGHAKNRGLDCSSLISWLGKSSSRLSTADVYFGGLASGVTPYPLDEEKKIKLSQAVESWKASPQGSILEDFEFILSIDDLRPGDIVNWRNPAGGGHVAVFGDWTNKEKGIFFGIDDNRFDSYMDGPCLRNYTLERTNMITTIIRSKKFEAGSK